MPDVELAFLMDRFVRQMHLALHARAPEFDTEKIGPGGAILLLTLADMEPTPMQKLTDRMARDKSQMTRAIKSLEDKGLVQRVADKADARVSIVSLTPAGQDVVDVHRVVIAEVLDDTLAPISDVEKSLLKDLLARVV